MSLKSRALGATNGDVATLGPSLSRSRRSPLAARSIWATNKLSTVLAHGWLLQVATTNKLELREGKHGQELAQTQTQTHRRAPSEILAAVHDCLCVCRASSAPDSSSAQPGQLTEWSSSASPVMYLVLPVTAICSSQLIHIGLELTDGMKGARERSTRPDTAGAREGHQPVGGISLGCFV